MDFTYIVALLLSLMVGFAGSLVFLMLRAKSYRRLLASALIVSIIADFALLIDWNRADEITAQFLIMDAAFFVAYGLVGCTLGTLPILGIRWLYRTMRKRELRDLS